MKNGGGSVNCSIDVTQLVIGGTHKAVRKSSLEDAVAAQEGNGNFPRIKKWKFKKH
jgi:hypothetical protein